ncbi:o-succinylbenzoate synthase [Methylobacterium crusticola]|uniref:O-succinylbenzoate synthase n=1 Tax=Methylobacterium crusticola TaxID=1697972 RepID=A0ABQ4R5N3_9HYPH|nr:enolase C-terminal domain-like protein [Methylobacterium crusticola]GJD53007.1 o-succinylbenzoate synthase [Methylobacterium crusticola]
MAGIRLTLRDIVLFERPMRFTHPFRFGVARVEAAPQAFVRVRVETEHGASAGAAAEMMMPKWFDKDPRRSPDETVADLRASLAAAAGRYADAGSVPRTPFGLHAAARDPGEGRGPALVRAYGAAVIDRAVLDAALRAAGLGLLEGLRANAPGLDARLTPDLDDREIAGHLRNLAPVGHVALRHTVGLADPLDALEALLAGGALGYLKVKLGGDPDADAGRLSAVADLLARHAPGARVTLDANEGYDPGRLAVLLERLDAPALAGMRRRLLYVEQPFDRAETFAQALGPLAAAVPFVIDEADGDLDAFPRALALGYRGVSIKGCKGLYKGLLNAVRAAARPGAFVTAEDLTCQAGLAVQQDTALAAALGLAHAERNGHHYVAGFGPAPDAEAEAFAAAHPGLYVRTRAGIRLATAAGRLAAGSLLAVPGFAGGAEPDWAAMAPIPTRTPIQAPREIRA